MLLLMRFQLVFFIKVRITNQKIVLISLIKSSLHKQYKLIIDLTSNTCSKFSSKCSNFDLPFNTTKCVKLVFCNWEFFLQLITSNVDKYKSKVKLQSKVYATCQYHNNSHYVPLLANLVENCSTNLVKGCCQLHLTCE